MKKEFIPYKQALALKELGFDESCIAFWTNTPKYKGDNIQLCVTDGNHGYSPNSISFKQDFLREGEVLAPLYQQVFRFFREKHGYFTSPTEYDDDIIKKYDWHITKNLGDGRLLIEFVGYHNRYEEAELACLTKLIEIVKTK